MTTRRQTLKTLAALATIQLVPSRILGLNGQTPPSEVPTLSIIGCGGIKGYHGFREWIARVHIATPPYWHAFMAIAAARAGKKIWCEKPMSRTIGEGLAMVHEVGKQNRIFHLNTWFCFRSGFYGMRAPVKMLKKAVMDDLLGWPFEFTVSGVTSFDLKLGMWAGKTGRTPFPSPPPRTATPPPCASSLLPTKAPAPEKPSTPKTMTFPPIRIASITLLACASTALAADMLTMRPLFNGKDLTGWKGDGYIVENGAIVCTPKGRNLITEDTFSNFVLDFEFQLTPGANNGLGIHYPGTGDSAYTGMEIQILDSTAPKYKDLKDYQFHGGLYTMAAAKQGVLKPVGEWNQERVSVMGPAVKVELNGQIILRANLDDMAQSHPDHQGVKRRAGHIGWLGHGDRVAFRNINIGEIPLAANEPAVQAAGFTKIFDGSTLNGWKHTPDTTNWTASNGILKHNGKAGPINDLWTEKSYKDFTLVCDWRWSGCGPMKSRPLVMPDGSENGSAEIEELDSGIYLRGNTKSQVNLWNWNVGSGEVYGYRTDPKMPADVKAAVTPKAKADQPLGEWNRTMITLKGDRLTVSLNGQTVIENAQLPGIPASGPIGLQHHGSNIDFANIWVKEE